MAARENQGLQIALIIFVILTIFLIVMTYFFFSGYSEEREKAKSMAEQKASADTAMRQAVDEFDRIKLLIGAAQPDKIESIEEAARADMQTHGEGLVESKQNYRDLVKHMSEKLHEYEAMNTKLAAETKELNDKIKTNEEAAKAEVAKYMADSKQAETDRDAERKKFNTNRDEIKNQMAQLASKFQSTEADRQKVVQQSATQIAALTGELQQSEELRERMLRKDEADEKANEYPDGRVTRVNQRTRLVWLNIGAADGLRNQTSFVVVAPEDGNPVKSEPKGLIQVIRLTADHQAEARIVDDDLSNPIMPGDNVFSTVWERGYREHFALAGRMDIDGDGDSDRQMIHDLIVLNGGMIDAEVDEEGTKTGDLSVDTKYLVEGDKPDAAGKALDAYSAIITEAQKLGVKTIHVHEFLNYMGYRGQERTVNLGQFAKPSDFKPRMPEAQRVIPGSVLPKDIRRQHDSDRANPQ